MLFRYFHRNERDQKPEAKTIFCAPVLSAFNVKATASLNNGSLTHLEKHGEFTGENNVTRGDFAGKAFNGWVYNDFSKTKLTFG